MKIKVYAEKLIMIASRFGVIFTVQEIGAR